MKKIFVIISREYITRVRKRMFLVTTLLVPVLFASLTFLMIYLANKTSKVSRIAVVDESGIFNNKLVDDKEMFFKQEDVPFDKLKTTYDTLGYAGILHIPKSFDIDKAGGIELISRQSMGLASQRTLRDKISKVVYSLRLKENNVDEKVVEDAGKDVSVNFVLQSGNEEKEGSADVATGIGYAAGFLVYIMMFLYGNMVLRSVMEEKQTRIVEVIMSSVKPVELMLGKIIGVGLVGLTQFLLWMLLSFAVQLFMGIMYHDQLMAVNQVGMQPGGMSSEDTQGLVMAFKGISNLPWMLIISSFLFYFLGGYLLYAALFAAVGSAMSEDMEDNRGLNFIISLPIIIAYFMMLAALKDPNSTISTVGSLIPFTSPIVMSARLAFGVPTWELIASMLLLVLGFLFTTWLAARIYRTAILMYGKKITPRELLKWAIRSN